MELTNSPPLLHRVRGWIRRHQTALLLGAGAVGLGCIIYRSLKSHNQLAFDQEYEKEAEAARLERMDAHFHSIQKLSDNSTLPILVPELKEKLFTLMNISELTEKLMIGRGDPRSLGPDEKILLWEMVKISSVTRTSCAIISITILSLFARLQINVLGGHMYRDILTDLSVSKLQAEDGILSKRCQHNYLALAHFLSHKGLERLISDTETSVQKFLGGTRLSQPCTVVELGGIFHKIIHEFSTRNSHWPHYLLPDEKELFVDDMINVLSIDVAKFSMGELTADASDMEMNADQAKLRRLITETRQVLSSKEFQNLVSSSCEVVLGGVMEELLSTFREGGVNTMPLVKVLAPIANLGNILLEDPKVNRYVQLVAGQQAVNQFCVMVYQAAAEQ